MAAARTISTQPACRMPHAACRRRRSRRASGFTLAGLIVILTIIALFIAYTVPPQWSKIMQREREKQTIFAMRQYVRAIREWSKKNGSMPVKIDQIKEARLPRVIRGPKGELIDPLTGKVDWILIPPGAVQANTPQGVQPGMPPGVAPGTAPGSRPGTGTQQPATSTQPNAGSGRATTFNKDASPRDYVGPFVGVRPAASGPSILTFNGGNDYSQWYYTIYDLDAEVQAATMPNPNARP